MTQPDPLAPRPAFQISVVRLQCSVCGAQAAASCNCGQPYVVAAGQRAAEAIKANPEKSDRAIARDIGVSQPTVSKVRKSTDNSFSVEKRIGLDGKARKLAHGRSQVDRLKAHYGDPSWAPPPVQKDLLEQGKRVVEAMNWSTKDVFAQWLKTVY
jgi:hypothetical protein